MGFLESVEKLADNAEAAPMNVTWQAYGKPARNKHEYDLLSKDKRGTVLEEFAPGVILYRYPTKIALLDENDEKLLYIVQHTTRSFHGKKSYTQVKVWSKAGSSYTAGLARRVFFNILFKEVDCMVTDQYQTEGGRRLWEHLVVDALKRGYVAYFFDDTKGFIKQMNEPKDYENHVDEWYGDEESFRGKVLVIAKKAFWKDRDKK